MSILRTRVAAYCGALALCAAGAVPARADLAAAVSYYQGCESLKPALAGERLHPAPVAMPGKIGRAFLIERRTVNLVSDPDFKAATSAPPGPWLAIGTPRFVAKDGLDGGSSCTVTSNDWVRQVVTDLREGQIYCLSVYAASVDGGRLELAVKSGPVSKESRSQTLTPQYARMSLAFVAGAPTATLSLRAAASSVRVDAVQLEAGKSWPSSFMALDHQQRDAEWIDIPATPGVYDPMHGSVAFWLKPEWLGQTSPEGQGMFAAVDDPSLPFSKQSSLFAIEAYTDPTQKDWHNAVTVFFKDKDGKDGAYDPLLFDGSLQPDQWLHVLVTWDIEPGGQSVSDFYLDGRKAGSLKFTSAGCKPPTNIYAGYYGGAYLDGLIDEIYIFNRPLTDEEAREVYELKAPLTTPR